MQESRREVGVLRNNNLNRTDVLLISMRKMTIKNGQNCVATGRDHDYEKQHDNCSWNGNAQRPCENI